MSTGRLTSSVIAFEVPVVEGSNRRLPAVTGSAAGGEGATPPRGRLYLDTARNAYAQIALAPYAGPGEAGRSHGRSARLGRVGRKDFHPERYTLRNVFRRLSRIGDPWAESERSARSLRDPRSRLDELLAEEKTERQ